MFDVSELVVVMDKAFVLHNDKDDEEYLQVYPDVKDLTENPTESNNTITLYSTDTLHVATLCTLHTILLYTPMTSSHTTTCTTPAETTRDETGAATKRAITR